MTAHVLGAVVVFGCGPLTKSNNGGPCGDSSSRKNTGRCPHAGIVAVFIYELEGRELELEHDGEMDGMDFGFEGGVLGDEGGIGDDTKSVSYTQVTDPPLFAKNMAQLRVISSVYKFPVDEPEVKEGTYGRDTIHVNGSVCTGCGVPYDKLANGDATLFGQVGGGVEQHWSKWSVPLRYIKCRHSACCPFQTATHEKPPAAWPTLPL